eukprot:jgi/Botrbrau1/10502/Bobra.0133s0102.1
MMPFPTAVAGRSHACCNCPWREEVTAVATSVAGGSYGFCNFCGGRKLGLLEPPWREEGTAVAAAGGRCNSRDDYCLQHAQWTWWEEVTPLRHAGRP